MSEKCEAKSNPPQGWSYAPLGEICLSTQYGWTTSATKQGDLHLLRTTDITQGTIDWSSVPFCRNCPPDIEKYLLNDGDILISRAGSVGYSCLIKNPKKAIFASYLIRFRPAIDRRYLTLFLKSPSYWKSISEKSIGIALANVNASKLKQIIVPIAPLPEQSRIADKVEELFSFLDAGVESLRKVQAQLRRYRKAVLKYAFEGKLTEEWRKKHQTSVEPASLLISNIIKANQVAWESDKSSRIKKDNQDQESGLRTKKYGEFPSGTKNSAELPEHWIWVAAGQLFWSITSGSRGWAKYYSKQGAFFVRVGDLSHDNITINLRSTQHVNPPTGAEVTRTRVSPGDILISITADVGRIALVPEGIEESYVNQHVALTKSVPLFDRSYLAWFLLSPLGQKQLTSLQYGATKAGLGLDEIRRLNVPLAPLSEQYTIVERIERYLTALTKMEEIVEQSLKKVDGLMQSILNTAFEGRLVSQDANDEPAERLLERIKAERFNKKSKIDNQLELPLYVK